MIYSILFFVALGSFTGHVTSQTCSSPYPYAPCSSNSGCGCLPLSFTDDVGICAVLGVSCARLSPCRSSDYSCDSPNHICVQHPQCDSRPLCYPMVMIDQRLCPPSTNPPFPTTTTPMTTYMTTNMTTTMTTSTGQGWVVSSFSSSLNATSEMYSRSNQTMNSTHINGTSGYFFEAIELSVYENGFYNITSFSSMDTFGYLYWLDFSPFNTSYNLMASDDDSGLNSQFSIGSYLQAGFTYIVVVTTFQPNVTGIYTINVNGPQYVNMNRRNITGISTNNTTQSNLIQSYLWSALSNSTELLAGTNKHHQLITLYIATSGLYNITSASTMDTYGCLMIGSAMDPSNSTSSNRTCDDDSAGNGQFQILTNLEAGQSYTLLFTTFAENATGPYTLIVTGPDSVYMSVQSSASNFTSTSTWAPVVPMDVWSSYSDALTNSSATYMRPSMNDSFFFQAFELTVNVTGFYNISSYSSMDTMGYLYEWDFNPYTPMNGMINQDDDGAGNGQFRLTYTLQAGVRYILVATTFGAGVNGPFTVSAYGPGQIVFTPLYPSMNYNTTTIPSYYNTSTTPQTANMTSLYFGSLSNSSATFTRSGNSSSGLFYYQAVRISVNTSGEYEISSSSSFDSYGYLYQNRFDPNYTSINLIVSDDDSAGDRQFALRANLQANVNYVVIATTYGPQETGSFSLKISGPSVARISV